MRYVSTDFTAEGGEQPLVEVLNELDEKRGTLGNRVYYLAIPPGIIEPTVVQIGKNRATSGWTRLIVEKPFGRDAASARELNQLLTEHFDESEIYRIDHYLGKETVQNMLVLRFGNGIFEPIWNRLMVDHVQITVGESLGIEGRAGFYEQAGAIRDMFQNHLLQLRRLTAMEPPSDFTSESVRNEKLKVLRSIRHAGAEGRRARPVRPRLRRGRGGPGLPAGEGRRPRTPHRDLRGRELYIDNWRWADMPIYIRTGKRLPRRETTIAVQFKRAPHPPFESTRRARCGRTSCSSTSSPTRASRWG